MSKRKLQKANYFHGDRPEAFTKRLGRSVQLLRAERELGIHQNHLDALRSYVEEKIEIFEKINEDLRFDSMEDLLTEILTIGLEEIERLARVE